MTEQCALVEGPVWGDTNFYGHWLLAVSKANELWTEASMSQFHERVDRLLRLVSPTLTSARPFCFRAWKKISLPLWLTWTARKSQKSSQ
jgi:hypothetical protein